MTRQLTVATALVAASLLGLPAATVAQAPPDAPRLVTPLTAECYSGTFASPARARIANARLVGGNPRWHFNLYNSLTPGTPGVALKGGFFDEGGNATIPVLTLGDINQPVGPGKTYYLSLYADNARLPEAHAPEQKADFGPVKIATLGVQLEHLDGNPNGSYGPGQKNRVEVSGAPFAHKQLYGFAVAGGKRVVERFKLGTGDACGYAVRTNVVTHPKSFKGAGLKVYVNAGPKFDKAHAVRTRFA